MNRGRNIIVSLLVAAACAAPAQAGSNYATTQFVWNKNDNSWAYYNLDANNKLVLLPAENVESAAWLNDNGVPVQVPYWSNPGPGYPFVAANTTTQRLHRDFCCGAVYLPGKSLLLDPGTQRSEVVYLVPTVAEGTKVQLYYGFTDIDCHGGDGVKWYVRYYSAATKKWKNVVTPGTLFSDGSHCSDDTYATTTLNKVKNVPVSTGDRFAWIVENNGDPNYDSTAVSAIVTLP